MCGHDRRTIDKLVAHIEPAEVRGVTKLYRLSDVESALKQNGSSASLRDQKLIEEIRKYRIKNDRDEGKLVPREAVAESIRRCLGPVALKLEQKLVNEYPSAVAGLDVPQARIYGKRIVAEILKHYQELAKEWPE